MHAIADIFRHSITGGIPTAGPAKARDERNDNRSEVRAPPPDPNAPKPPMPTSAIHRSTAPWRGKLD